MLAVKNILSKIALKIVVKFYVICFLKKSVKKLEEAVKILKWWFHPYDKLKITKKKTMWKSNKISKFKFFKKFNVFFSFSLLFDSDSHWRLSRQSFGIERPVFAFKTWRNVVCHGKLKSHKSWSNIINFLIFLITKNR